MTDNRADRLGLEPSLTDETPNGNPLPLDREIAHSIAISLKRIADVMCRLYDADEARP